MRGTGKGVALGGMLVGVAALLAWLALGPGDGPEGGGALVRPAEREAERPPGFEQEEQAEPMVLAQDPADPSVPAEGRAADVAEAGAATGRLVVRVTWESDGQPAAGVGVSIVEFDAAGSPRSEHRSVTDAAGTTARDGLLPGKVGAFPDRANGGLADVRAGETAELAMAIPAGVLVRGLVTAGDGWPVAGADIRLGMGNGEEGHRVARSDAGGRFTLRDVREYATVGAQAEGRVPSPLAVVRGAPGQAVDVTLVLGPAGAALAGRVLDARGEPLAGAEVQVGPPGGWPLPRQDTRAFEQGPPPRRVFADAQGGFALRDLPPGRWPLAARHPGHSPWQGECELQAEVTQEQDIVLPAAVVLAGVVRDGAGRPVADARVTCGRYLEMDWQETRSAADGRYELSGLPLPAASVRASAKGVGKDERELATRAGERLEWDPVLTEGLTITGRVVDAAGAPAVAHHVDAAHYAPGRTITAQAITDGQGRFLLANCADGEHELRVHTPDWKTNVAVVRGVRPGPEEVVVTLLPADEPSAFLMGRLLDTAGQVPAQVMVAASDARTGRGELEPLDATGAFRCGPLRPGAWELHAVLRGQPNHPLGRFELVAGETRDVGALLLPRPGRLVVHASLPPGADPGRCVCHARSSAGRDAGLLDLQEGATATWASGPLEPGGYEVTLQWASGGPDDVFIVPASAAARVEEGRDTRVDLLVQRGVAQAIRLHSPRVPAPAAHVAVTDAAGREVLSRDVRWYSLEEAGPEDDDYHALVGLPGPYTLRVTCAGVVVAERGFELPAGVNLADEVIVELP